MRRLWIIVATIVCLVAPTSAGSAPADLEAGRGQGLKLVANIPYLGGTDMELATIRGRDYAFVGSAPHVGRSKRGAFRVIDVTKPENPKVVAKLDCSLWQADVQLSHDLKTAILAADIPGEPGSCLAMGKGGFMTIDISDPTEPKVAGFAETGGSHNTTAHPIKPLVYSSQSALDPTAGIQVWSIADPARPKLMTTLTSIPESSHDISFNADGTMMVAATYEQFSLFDTTDPLAPELIATSQCPGCTATHDAKFTPDGTGLVIGDESGGGEAFPCPGGALYFYELVGGRVPVLTGAYEPDPLIFADASQSELKGCTSHVFDISKDGRTLAVSWYSAGVRYLDISSTQGVTRGSTTTGGVEEIGWFIGVDSLSWASKFHRGPYIYANDKNRGFDVLKIVGG